MDRETARQEIKKNWRRIVPGLLPSAKRMANREASYVCPFCNHGAGGDGLTFDPRSTDGNTLHCFGCGFSGDIIDLYQKMTGNDYNTALSYLADEIGITIEAYRPINNSTRQPKARTEAHRTPQEAGTTSSNKVTAEDAQKPAQATAAPAEGIANYWLYYDKCAKRLNDPAAVAYLTGRGISIETAAAYWIGFDPEADPANAPGDADRSEKKFPEPRIIIPDSTAHYVGRAIAPDAKFAKVNPAKAKGAGAVAIFNSKVLYAQGVQEVFVTEGVFDALSIIEAGAAAIALNSTSNKDLLVKMLEERPTEATLILCLDNDTNGAGQNATAALKKELQRLNVSHIVATDEICGKYKDANEHLQKSKDSFLKAVQEAQHKTAARPDNVTYYIDNLMNGDLENFETTANTGYKDLDDKTAGLYSGLYVLAAISSLGKTTFAAQMADQIAAAGHDVLFFSMEQSRLEMVSKSLARRMYQKDPETAITSLQIRRGHWGKYNSRGQWIDLTDEVIKISKEYKQEVQEHLSFIEGNFNCTISYISDYIRQYIRRNNTSSNGQRPIVFIDYLQVLQPDPQPNGRKQTIKETIDECMIELKRMSRELNITVILISSVNRTNYLTPIDFESLKESGSIEYTADVIWGLQLQILNDPLFDAEKHVKEKREIVKLAKKSEPRKIELSCLKNRYGISSYSVYFDYYPANDCFTACKNIQAAIAPEPKAGKKR